jgi:MtfA peptidase
MTTTSLISLLLLCIILAAVVFIVYFWPSIKRARIHRQHFPDNWIVLLERRLLFFAKMDSSTRLQLQNLIKEFLQDKRFVGCAGQKITDEIRLVVAAQACLLLLNRETSMYSDLQSILVYPETFLVRRESSDELGLVSEELEALEGESWSQGKVVLAWDSVSHSVADFSDGHNVVLHEFAHQLDSESGLTNGAPLLGSRNAYKSWSRAFAAEFAELQQRADADLPSLIDYYGASNPAEFFAVVTELFFERPHEMQQIHSELYREMQNFYRVDPREWSV